MKLIDNYTTVEEEENAVGKGAGQNDDVDLR